MKRILNFLGISYAIDCNSTADSGFVIKVYNTCNRYLKIGVE